MPANGQRQVAVRMDDDLIHKIDRKRMELASPTKGIPTRSDVVRIAVEAFLEQKPKGSTKGK